MSVLLENWGHAVWLQQKICLLQATWQLVWTPGCQICLKAAAVLINLHCITHGNYSQEGLLEILRQIHSIIITVLFSPAQFNTPFATYSSGCADWLHMPYWFNSAVTFCPLRKVLNTWSVFCSAGMSAWIKFIFPILMSLSLFSLLMWIWDSSNRLLFSLLSSRLLSIQ